LSTIVKVARLYQFDDIRIEDEPVPRVGPRDALIRAEACGICSGDVMPWYIEKKAPLVLGHEPVGQLVELGSSIKSGELQFSVGARLFVHHHAPCLICAHCKRGDYVQCETWRRTTLVPGGISEYILVPEINLRHDTLPLPPQITSNDGALTEPAACVVKSLRRASIREGDAVLVIGLGVMGLLHVLLAREFGAGKIIGADLVPYRLSKAVQFGADEVIDVSRESLVESLREFTRGQMASIVIVCPNSAEAMMQGIETVAPGGTVVFFTPGRPGELLHIDPNSLYFRDISIVTSYSCGPDDTRRALDFVKRGVVTAEKLVTHRFTIDETEKAFRMTAEARDSLKCLIVF
jgi:L-iditol 2-dehydrogenase